jgi:pilus assembly protein TadC
MEFEFLYELAQGKLLVLLTFPLVLCLMSATFIMASIICKIGKFYSSISVTLFKNILKSGALIAKSCNIATLFCANKSPLFCKRAD